MTTRRIPVLGMTKQEDLRKISNAMHDVWGVRGVEVSLSRGEVLLDYDEKAASFEDFQQAIETIGYSVGDTR